MKILNAIFQRAVTSVDFTERAQAYLSIYIVSAFCIVFVYTIMPVTMKPLENVQAWGLQFIPIFLSSIVLELSLRVWIKIRKDSGVDNPEVISVIMWQLALFCMVLYMSLSELMHSSQLYFNVFIQPDFDYIDVGMNPNDPVHRFFGWTLVMLFWFEILLKRQAESQLKNKVSPPSIPSVANDSTKKHVSLDGLQIKNQGEWVSVNYSDIVYIKVDENYCSVWVNTSGASLTRYYTRSTLSEIIDKLPSDKFVKTHRSYIVNRESIQTITSEKNTSEITLVNTEVKIPVSRRRLKEIRQGVNVSGYDSSLDVT